MDLTERHIIYRSNAFPGIVKTLADQLGVSSESLERLGVGWKIDSHAWSFPERDAEGNVIGILLRGWDGKKLMVSGSKRGLIYVPNRRKNAADSSRYVPGPQNWTRTDGNIPCPICEKTSACLVSAAQPQDPAAVLCCRKSSGSVKSFGDFHLHILREEHTSKTEPIITTSDYPILITEGASDVAAAMDLEFVAIGRSNSTGGLDKLTVIVAGRDVIILGENDAGAGREGMEKTFEALRSAAKSATKIMPPEGIKDLRAWVRSGLSRQELLDVISSGSTETADETLTSDEPIDIARRWLKEEHVINGIHNLHYYNEEWYNYVDGVYRPVTERTIISQLYLYLEGRDVIKKTGRGPTTELYKATDNKIRSIQSASKAVCVINHSPPCWLDNHEHPAPCDVVVFRNGILDVRTGRLMPSTPVLFVTTAAPYDYDPSARCPQWKQFLWEVFKDDDESIRLLQEWFGYCMVRERTHEKLMLLIGRTGSGKGTTMAALEAVLGSDQCTSSSFSTMASDFGLQHLIDKTAILIPDARLSRRSDTARALESILTISGFDAIEIRRKFLPTLQYILPGRITIGTNEFPNLPDHTQALERRLLLLHFNISFAEKMNVHLKDQLRAEAPGIANWALDGLRRLREQTKFTVPEVSRKICREFMMYMSPIAAFVEECCTIDNRAYALTSQFRDVWKAWANGPPVSWSMQKIGMDLCNHVPSCNNTRHRIKGQLVHIYAGIKLTDDALTRYLGKPGGSR